MEPLIERMKILLATQFAFYLKLHFFHWNVTGPNFPQYHQLFGELYEEVWGSVDEVAEHIRAIKGFAPGSFARYIDMSMIKDQVDVIPAEAMINQALQDNQTIIDQLNIAFRAAEQAGEIGLANYIQDRVDIHKKHGWKLRATLG